ncbi:MAG: protein kinase, partial [Planctomycetaceae bacterium]|nr:protein kinase [Planctomycetaceae bacterium]
MPQDESSPPVDATRLYDPGRDGPMPDSGLPIARLNSRYAEIVNQDAVDWNIRYVLTQRLGSGGQGVVFLTDREGAFGVNFRLALKFHRPEGYPTEASYRQEMARMARIAMDVARIQQDHLLDVYNAVEHSGILVLVTEWVDGFDIRQLLSPRTLAFLRHQVDRERWKTINDVVLTKAGFQSRFKVGVAISILRECLAGLAALHREGIVHADVKPSNVMVKRSGNCKLIDLGSAYRPEE